ncbi:hypothetical protein DICPUDRAFT_156603 [Dictyostelium purpureum]|uniref:Uncharacterized protein n=1 Tax=Dictyostelium purpureum TaxID=5786 RepID=F0ZX02_DICPU|nr:uncharacterized protein DICPUDRAFT_156603 [Dictyostelium purpureum]EGC31518.1 hypothetical protein DICPUDRAFT_156603 [Dictyostelium purpureum]|eukprot:XP_003291946.1 hypothetical protein DICPUDRAFT_156603 [Dictyostelium purpureum]
MEKDLETKQYSSLDKELTPKHHQIQVSEQPKPKPKLTLPPVFEKPPQPEQIPVPTPVFIRQTVPVAKPELSLKSSLKLKARIEELEKLLQEEIDKNKALTLKL